MRSSGPRLPLLLLALALAAAPAAGRLQGTPTSANCTELWYDQTLDHFNWGPPHGGQTYRQRYFVYDKWWRAAPQPGPVFFYLGNEDDVTLYVNHTGLMWEHAEAFGALLVFAEHRYYGRSLPFADGTPGCMHWLTTEQAMADYVQLLDHLRATVPGVAGAPVIGFGGSYGGMLASWFRLKYPSALDGAVAGSAPIWSFLGQQPPYDAGAFYAIVSADASSAGGATDYCRANVKAALPRIDQLRQTADGLRLLGEAFATCEPLATADDGYGLIFWATDPWATLAMGDFPYPSSYLLHGHGLLPAWPVRQACASLDRPLEGDAALLGALRSAMGVWYNHTGDVRCYYNGNSTEHRPRHRTMLHGPRPWRRPTKAAGPVTACTGDWDYQWCTEMVQPFSSGLGEDMFYPPSPFDMNASIAHCQQTWGVTPRPLWARFGLDGQRIAAGSNIVFSNGQYDPWHAGGVLTDVSSSITSLWVPSGAHHLDLMFSDPADPQDVIDVRNAELALVRQWVEQAYAKKKRAA